MALAAEAAGVAHSVVVEAMVVADSPVVALWAEAEVTVEAIPDGVVVIPVSWAVEIQVDFHHSVIISPLKWYRVQETPVVQDPAQTRLAI